MSLNMLQAQTELVEAAYATSLDSAAWPEMVACAQRWFDGLGAVYARSEARPDENRLLATSYDGAFKASYNAHYAAINPLIAARRRPTGPLLHSEEVIAYDDLRRTEFYADWMAPQDMDFGISLEISAGGDTALHFAILRSQRRGRFDGEETALCRTLAIHLRRALAIAERLGRAEGALSACLDQYDAVATGVLLVDAEGRLVFANREGERLLRAGDGLRLVGGRPVCGDSRAESALRAGVAAATRIDGPRTSAAFAAPRRERHAPLSMTVSPAGAAGEGRIALMLAHDPERLGRPDPEALREVWGLTPAEARLAAALCEGLSLADHARRQDIALTTAQTHLKAVFAKMDVSRQSHLIRRLSADPAVWRGG